MIVPAMQYMGKRVAIVQSNYIPWKGYFDLIHLVDEFILLDDLQYTRRDWRNRNKIKTPSGLEWLTIPVQVKGKYFQAINETRISEPEWNVRHWRTIAHNYATAPYFDTCRSFLQQLYESATDPLLSRVNYHFLKALCDFLNIKTKISWSSDYELVEGKTERLISLCKQANASEYVSGPSAQNYLDEAMVADAGLSLHYMDYSGYPEYNQLYPPFEHGVSILDLILSEGPNATRCMKTF